MWFLGLIVGAIVGSIGGGQGLLAGAVVGFVAGLALRRKGAVVDETWKNNVEDALRQLHHRVEALEKGGVTTPAAPAVVDPQPEPVAEPPASQPDIPDWAKAAAVAPVANVPAQPPAEPAEMPRETVPPAMRSDDPITRWLFGGNTLVRVGVIVLFFGVAFLL